MPESWSRPVNSCVPLLIAAKDEDDFHRFLFISGVALNECLLIRTPQQLQYFPGETVLMTPALSRHQRRQSYQAFCDHYGISCLALLGNDVPNQILEERCIEVTGK